MDKHGPKKSQKATDERLDDALDDSFPASDPPSMTDPHKHTISAPLPDEKSRPGKSKAGKT